MKNEDDECDLSRRPEFELKPEWVVIGIFSGLGLIISGVEINNPLVSIVGIIIEFVALRGI